MYFLTGPAESLETVLLLSARHREGGSNPREAVLSETDGLRRAYHSYLRSLGGKYPGFDDGGARLIDDDREAAVLAAAFGLVAPRSTAAAPSLDRWEKDLCQNGFARLQELDPGLAQVFDLVVAVVFSTPSPDPPGSMTTGELPGVVWVGPTRSWSATEVAEAYVHELTHTLLTLDEHRYGHYADYAVLNDADNLCVSAIRDEKRPLNAVAHSALVAYELLRMRSLLSGKGGVQLHAPSEELRRRALASYESILALPNLSDLCTPRMIELVAALGIGLREESGSVV